MAKFVVHGLDELYEATSKARRIPRSVTGSILQKMGEVLKFHVTKEALARKIWDTGEVVRSIRLAKPKIRDDGGSIAVTFTGSRTRGKTTTRNAEIAFVNEYGKRGRGPKQGQAARPFVKEATERSVDEANAAGTEELHRWLNEIGL